MAINDPRVAAKNLAFSAIRTIVPAAVTWITGVLTSNFGPLIGEETKSQIAALLYFAAFSLYYLAVRVVETYVAPKFSFLLGDFRKGMTAPVYPETTGEVVIPPAVEDPADGGDGPNVDGV